MVSTGDGVFCAYSFMSWLLCSEVADGVDDVVIVWLLRVFCLDPASDSTSFCSLTMYGK